MINDMAVGETREVNGRGYQAILRLDCLGCTFKSDSGKCNPPIQLGACGSKERVIHRDSIVFIKIKITNEKSIKKKQA